jgi:uncharacterized DUF497 family protein
VAHISKHSVKVGEVEIALRDSNLKFLEAKNDRFFALGRVDRRLLSIVLAKEKGNRFYVVTARDMSKTERRFYRNE